VGILILLFYVLQAKFTVINDGPDSNIIECEGIGLKTVPKSKACEVRLENYSSVVMTDIHVLCILKFRRWWSKKKKQGIIADF